MSNVPPLPIEASDTGCWIRVLINPRASRTQSVGEHDGRVKIQLAAPPVDGKANKALVVFLASALGVSKAAIRLHQGHANRRKTVHVEGILPEDAAACLLGQE